ncbi:MAG TPA: hypothetical protein VFS04_04545 [Alphaproteobacteria bacterium]|nr:hypothetical protein [Alphaproteobacteria bacterium]
MIGRTTFLWLLLAALAGYALFQVKYQVVSLEEELARLNAATLREQNQIHVLEAEWSYLNQPQRLEELNERFVHLKPINPAQYGTVASLPARPERLDVQPGTRLPGTDGMIARMAPPRRPQIPGVTPTAPTIPAPAAGYSTAAAPAIPAVPVIPVSVAPMSAVR